MRAQRRTALAASNTSALPASPARIVPLDRDDDPAAGRLAPRGTTIAEALHALVSEVDIEPRLRDAGPAGRDIHAVRDRMIVDNFGYRPR
jgi:hypothetical protein